MNIKIFKRYLLWFFIIGFLTLPALKPIFHNGFFVTDDGEWMIIRLSAFYNALRDGQIPVRFLTQLNHGFGYPVSNFLYPAYLYIGSGIHLFGFGFVETVEIILGSSVVLSFFFTVIWLRRYFHIVPALGGAVMYLYAPYYLFDLYSRGSVGEALFLAILPLFFWSIEKKNQSIAAISYGLLILSHNTLSLIFTPVLFAFLLLRGKKMLWVFPFGFGLSAFFWLPAIYERKYVLFDRVIVSNWKEYFIQDGSLLGLGNLIIFGISLWMVTRQKKRRRLVLLFIGIATLGLFFSSSLSSVLWFMLPLGKFIQFPWRFLSLFIISIGFITAWVMDFFSRKVQFALFFFLLFLSLPYVRQAVKKMTFINKGETYYTTNDATTTIQNEYMPRWVKDPPRKRPDTKVVLADFNNVLIQKAKTNHIVFYTKTPQSTTAQINTVYYPGWQASVDNQPVPISIASRSGVIQISLSAGNHKVEVKFVETLFRRIANMISATTALLVLLIGVRGIRRHYA